MLNDSEFLNSGSQELRELLSAASRVIEMGANEVLFEENDEGDALYVLVRGRIELSLLWEDGRRLALDLMRPGAIFGEIALFDPGPRTATATTLEPCKLIQLRNRDVTREIERSPELAIELLHIMGRRMRWMNQQLHEYVFLPLPARLARKLLYLTPESQDGQTCFKLSQTELAEFAGATREAVSKTLASWKQQGILKTGRGTVELLDRPALRRVAGL